MQFLTFSVIGATVRPFMQLLQTASKQGDGIFFEPRAEVLHVRVVNNARTTHFLVSVSVTHLEGYRCVTSAEDDSAGNRNTEPLDRHKLDKGPHLHLLTKALVATVLRQSVASLSAIHVRYDGVPSTEHFSPDALQLDCVLSNGIVKKYMLPLAGGLPERIYVPPEHYTFDACAEAKKWGSLLAFIPASAPHVVLQPQDGHLTLWVADSEEGHTRGQTAETAEPPKRGGAATTVLAPQEHFLFIEQRRPVQLPEVGGEGHPAPGAEGVLPGKIIEARPFKQVCLLAEQLGMLLRVRTGGEGLPLLLEAITPQDARLIAQLQQQQQQQQLQSSISSSSVAGLSTPVLLPHKLASATEGVWRMSFSMHIAALDAAPQGMDGVTERPSAGRLSTNTNTHPNAPNAGVSLGASGGDTGAAPEPFLAAASQSTNGTGRPTNEPSVVEASRPSLGGQSVVNASPDGMVMQATPYSPPKETETKDAERLHSKRPRESAETKTQEESPWRVSATMASVVENGSGQGASAQVPHPSQANASTSSHVERTSLDFAAFLRDLAEDEEAEDNEEEDAELQRFLNSCASMVFIQPTPQEYP